MLKKIPLPAKPEDVKEDAIHEGSWAGKPSFTCMYCLSTVGDRTLCESHIYTRHILNHPKAVRLSKENDFSEPPPTLAPVIKR